MDNTPAATCRPINFRSGVSADSIRLPVAIKTYPSLGAFIDRGLDMWFGGQSVSRRPIADFYFGSLFIDCFPGADLTVEYVSKSQFRWPEFNSRSVGAILPIHGWTDK